MNKKLISLLLAVIMIISAFVLSSCSEKEPLPEGVSELPDLNASELAESLADESGVIQWPAELLPEGFPVPEYEKIYSIEREDNELIIILCGLWDKNKVKTLSSVDPGQLSNYYDILLSDRNKYSQALSAKGYKKIRDVGMSTDSACYLTPDGWRIWVKDENDGIKQELADAMKQSSVGYAYEITARQVETHESYFWTYPQKTADIGYPDLGVVESWPKEYVPDNFSDLTGKINVLKIEVKNSGVFVEAVFDDVTDGKLGSIVSDGRYLQIDENAYIDPKGDYFFLSVQKTETPDGIERHIIIQICKCNDKIIKQ